MALTPPLAVSKHSNFMQVFLHVYIYMFFKQERTEMDDFEEEKLGIREKASNENTDTEFLFALI